MTEVTKPLPRENVACEICLKEVPISEAKSDEASDYMLYFCGLECYAKWKSQKSEPEKGDVEKS
ncbi:MAG: DUF3330 domain-containing protein [Gammaproteobacteria bacterium]|nr:DUF3330 domain-containing protein [Gammaproteobacteria bacterium]